MKQRPILFSTGMVQAILEGRKTQTRRVVKPQPVDIFGEEHPLEMGEFHTTVVDRNGNGQEGQLVYGAMSEDGEFCIKCPYGQPGDVLWVRESWAPIDRTQSHAEGQPVWYKADQTSEVEGMKWKPSIHMPRAACRLFLKIKSVRVERLHDISEEDAKAEGIERGRSGDGRIVYKHYLKPKYGPSPVHSFQTLWEKINGAESWESNTWVWVVEFERVEKLESVAK